MIDFITQNLVLSIVFITALISYISFELFNWLSGGSVKDKLALNVDQITSLINHNKALIIDIRTTEEYNIGHIVDAINIEANNCNINNATIKNNINHRPIVIVDKDGSSRASNITIDLYKSTNTQIYYLKGGIIAWKALNMPLVQIKPKANHNIVIYTKPNCPYCLSAKNLLTNKGLTFKEITPNAGGVPELANKTMPQIIINNQNIGGFDSLKKLNDSGELNKILDI